MLHSLRSGGLVIYHGAYLRLRPLGERHHYRDGGRLGNPVVGEETSHAGTEVREQRKN